MVLDSEYNESQINFRGVGGEYWNGSKCTKCEATYYTETGVYASASGASNDSGCKRCPEDTSVLSWLNTPGESGLWDMFGPGGSNTVTYVFLSFRGGRRAWYGATATASSSS